jgi:hypothetical protein
VYVFIVKFNVVANCNDEKTKMAHETGVMTLLYFLTEPLLRNLAEKNAFSCQDSAL